MNLYDVLKKLNIVYEKFDHEPVYTVEQACFVKNHLNGVGCKNLFLRDKEHRFYLVFLKDDKRGDLKQYQGIFNCSKLTFASENDLETVLKLEKGSVTPLGIINDNSSVTLLIDEELLHSIVTMHPLVNTATIALSCKDLIRFIEYFKNSYFLL